VLISALHHCNLAALCARECIGLPDKVLVSERNPLSSELAFVPGRKRYLLSFIQLLYPKADKVIAISKRVAEDLALTASLRHEHIRTIYNPIMTPGLYALSKHNPDHPWFQEKEPPVILSIGRLTPQKDFPTLFRAFARARKKKRLRLIILGEGDLRAELEELSRELEISEDVAFMGFVDNPYSYAGRASLFVLSSAWEGFGNVVVEALACGCPVVSTDCPGGPAEILGYGKYGTLVPVGDDTAMAEAIINSINREHDREGLRERAGKFSIEASVNAYMELINGK
jgi:glycosyltransferase involved in cell wall biosynthesis